MDTTPTTHKRPVMNAKDIQIGDTLDYDDLEEMDDRERDDFRRQLRVDDKRAVDTGSGYRIVSAT